MDQDNNEDNRKYSVSKLSVAQELSWPESEPEFGGHVNGVTDEHTYVHLKERTAGPMGMLLIRVIFGLVLVHYGSVLTLILLGHQEATDRLSGIFSGWLPVVSGLVGAVVVHYFHEGRKKQ